MQLSKQHYADELVNLGAVVYFLNPPQIHLKFKLKYNTFEHKKSLVIINCKIPFYTRFKYRFFNTFSFVQKKCIEQILKEKKIEIDILWNFDNGLVCNAHIYSKAKITIFHPVDQLRIPLQVGHYNHVFSLSDEILGKVSHRNKNFINHGLSEKFDL